MTVPPTLLLAFSEEYAVAGSVALETALGHLRTRCDVVVGSVDLSHSSVRRIHRIAANHGASLTTRAMSPLLEGFPVVGRYPSITWTRVLVEDVVSPEVEKVLYLDADVLVRRSLDPLLSISLRPSVAAAVIDPAFPTHGARGADYARALGVPPGTPYFNSGVLLIDVEGWSRHGVGEKVSAVVRRRSVPLDFVDQDALNAVLLGRWRELDPKWNSAATADAADPSIVQFVGSPKPWVAGEDGPFVGEFRAAAREIALL